MREYGQVQCAFWHSADALGNGPDNPALSDGGKLLALYLLTGPHSNGLGCYRMPDGYLMADLGWNAETIAERFAELSRKGFAYRFDGVVFLPNFLRWNSIANPNVASARFKEFESLPKGEAKSRLARAMLDFSNHWANGSRKVLETVAATVRQTVTQTEPNHTQPEREAKPATVVAMPSPDDYRAKLWAGWKSMPDSGGGAYLGKLIKAHGEQPVLEAVERTIDTKPADPKGYIVGLLRKTKADEDALDGLFRSAK